MHSYCKEAYASNRSVKGDQQMSTKTKKPVNKKRMLNHVEELALKRIQIELDTQDTNGQAPPQYYTIRDFAHVYGDKLNDPDGIIIYSNYSGEPIMTFDIGEIEDESVIKKLINYIKENVDDIDENAIDEDVQSSYQDVCDLIDRLQEQYPDFDIYYQQYQTIPQDSNFFLTKKAAQKHLEENSHHYSEKATIYSHTIWRSEEEILYHILKEIDLDKYSNMSAENTMLHILCGR